MASSDINNFSSSPPHRLATVSASQALQNISSTPRRPISTGLRSLDVFLQGKEHETLDQNTSLLGIPRGEVTEVYGPPGVGKTALALQIAASALHSGGSVVWVDAANEVIGSRLKDIISNFHVSEGEAISDRTLVDEYLGSFHHFITPSLPHLLALLTHPSPSFPPIGTSLIVVDSISSVFALAYPKTAVNATSQQTPAKKNDAARWASGRRWAVMGDFISKINRLAATNNIAVLLTSQTTTRIEAETGAVLHPAISGKAWDTGISTRIVIFRDWMFQASDAANSQGEYISGVRFAGVVKAKGISYEGVGKVATFVIDNTGLQEISVNQTDIKSNESPVLQSTSLKRKRGEIADSQSEDEQVESDREFDWAVEDDATVTEAALD